MEKKRASSLAGGLIKKKPNLYITSFSFFMQGGGEGGEGRFQYLSMFKGKSPHLQSLMPQNYKRVFHFNVVALHIVTILTA